MERESFFDIPYGDRQLITFVPDSLFEESSPNWRFADNATGDTIRWAQYLELAAGVIFTPILAGPVSAAVTAIVNSQGAGGDQGIELRGRRRILPVRKSWADLFKLPPGHPRDKVVFAAHPAERRSYLPLSDFHRQVFEHKFAELLSLLMHLGATKIQVRQVEGWGHSFTERLSIGISPIAVKQKGGVSDKASRELLYEAELNGTSEPVIPPNLVWYPHERTWQQVAQGRLEFGLKNFGLNLQYQEDYGIDFDLKAKVQQCGLELGGGFEKCQSTTWEMSGSFKV